MKIIEEKIKDQITFGALPSGTVFRFEGCRDMFLKAKKDGVIGYVSLEDGLFTAPICDEFRDLKAQPVEPVSGAFVEGYERL